MLGKLDQLSRALQVEGIKRNEGGFVGSVLTLGENLPFRNLWKEKEEISYSCLACKLICALDF